MLRKFIAICLMLCLPLQAVAAIAMPFCQFAAAAVMTEHENMMHCDHVAAQSDHRQAPPAHGHDSCDNCGFCHLASAGMIPLSFLLPSELPPARVYALPPEQSHVSHIPEQPQRPPRAA